MNAASPKRLPSNTECSNAERSEAVEPVPESHLRLTPIPPLDQPDFRVHGATAESYTRRLGLPYVGLRAFGESDHDVFRGREGEVASLIGMLGAQHFVAVVGPRHSGRTSLVEAGLIGTLRRRDGQDAWLVARMNAGSQSNTPRDELRQALVRLSRESRQGLSSTDQQDETTRLVRASLDDAADALERAAEHLLSGNDQRLLLVVDGFETLTREPGSAEQRFVRQLLRATLDQRLGGRVNVVLMLGEGALSECGQFPGLAAALTGSMVVLERPQRDTLRNMITSPLGVSNWRATPALCEQLLGDVEGLEAPLPVLQHALLRMAQHAKHTGVIDLTTYAAAGCPDALNAHGREVLDSMNAYQQELTRLVFCGLLSSATGRVVSVPCTREQLASDIGIPPTDPDFRHVLRTFGATDCCFLRLPTDGSLEAIELGHPALLDQWHSLRDWAAQELEDGETHRTLLRLAQDEARAEGESVVSVLLRDPQLSNLENWWARRRPTKSWARRHSPLTERESDAAFELVEAYLRRSRERERAETAARLEAERVARLEADRRRRKWRLWSSVAGGTLLLAATTIAGVVYQRDEARTEARVAETRLESASRDNARLRANEARLSSDLEQQKREAESLESQLELLESERASLIGTGAVLQEALDALQTRHDLIVRAHDAALIQAEQTMAQLKRAQSELAAAENRARAASAELERHLGSTSGTGASAH